MLVLIFVGELQMDYVSDLQLEFSIFHTCTGSFSAGDQKRQRKATLASPSLAVFKQHVDEPFSGGPLSSHFITQEFQKQTQGEIA